ncbi:Unknown protein [Striga hermonthica]|uniref:Wall-associated receptor kinase galacturonan-binding domain-containing protein n=1 Tax=Striga hermonthica TaxID=68872 RepID=A0A9N7MWH7_STRHE|nr:Unknown protein [Striga hermonthica]
MACLLLATLLITLHTLIPLAHTSGHADTCRSFCGNLTVSYPFALHPGCGHSAFRDLLFCINDVLMLHISSGSYLVLDIDYAYGLLVLHEPHMSTCDSLVYGGLGNGFVVEPWRARYLGPTTDNVFMLLGCSARSPLFQGFPGKNNSPCRNVSGLGCEEYYGCPAWETFGLSRGGPIYETGPPDCCAVPYEMIRSVNLSSLECQGYSSAYSLAPLRVSGPGQWAYGIQVKYNLQGIESFCRACEATGGSCGYEIGGNRDLCMCGSWNSTSNCDAVKSGAFSNGNWSPEVKFAGLLLITKG